MPLVGFLSGWHGKGGLRGRTDGVGRAVVLARGWESRWQALRKCLYINKLFAIFVETSCVRQYGLGGIGGKDLYRPDISFLRWKGFFSMGEKRRFITYVLMVPF